MKSSILRAISLCSRNLYPNLHTKQTPALFPSLRPGPSSILMKYRFFSSENPNPNCPIPDSKSEQLDKAVDIDSNDPQDLSNEALKKKIDRLTEGDEDAIPEIFEAILKRKLTGESDEADEELMRDVRRNPQRDNFSDIDFDTIDEASGVEEDESD